MTRYLFIIASAASAALGFAIWLGDSITPNGQRTVFTAECEQGAWHGSQCDGKLTAGRRYVFQSIKKTGEVDFWVIGSLGSFGRYTNCSIRDGRDWFCKLNEDATRTIAHELVKGAPVHDASGSTLAFHQVQKWKWLLLKFGLPAGHEAMA